MTGNWQNSSEFPRDFLSIGRFSSDFSAALWRQELGQSGGFSHFLHVKRFSKQKPYKRLLGEPEPSKPLLREKPKPLAPTL